MSNPFKTGDKVICIKVRGMSNVTNMHHSFGDITVDKSYTVRNTTNYHIFVDRDKGKTCYDYPYDFFKLEDNVSSITGKEEQSMSLIKVAIQGVKLATASTPEKVSTIVEPTTVEAYDANEAMVLVAVQNHKAITDAKYDRLKVSSKCEF